MNSDHKDTAVPASPVALGLNVRRYYTKVNEHPYDQLQWERRKVEIKGGDTVVFSQDNVEAPVTWSALATQVTASKYFRGTIGTPDREDSVKTLINRVVSTITQWGDAGKYFVNDDARDTFEAELTYLMVNQHAAFNSPVWFNLGVPGRKQQSSACFINAVDDNMESILDLAKTEGMLFKGGSGTGSNLSTLRSSKEKLRGGGDSSGPVSFMRAYDALAGVIKSGGASRRSAKMVILNADHPDIFEFIETKVTAERIARALIAAGFSTEFNAENNAYNWAPFQNANHSVRVTDDFMRKVQDRRDWDLNAVTNGRIVQTVEAAKLFDKIVDAAWESGDPGLQFDTTINEWHTVPNSGRINGSNPCLRRGSRLLTESGWRTIESMDGQEPMLFDGIGFTKGKVWKTGHKEIVRLHINNGRTVDVTPDHQIYTENGWVEAKDTEGLAVPVVLPNVNLQGESQLPKCITGLSGAYYSSRSQELMEALGFLQGDGGFNPSTRSVVVHFTAEKDGDFVRSVILPLLSDVAAEKGESEYAPSVLNGSSGFVYTRQRLYNWLIELGMQPVPLPERKLPFIVWDAKKPTQCAFLRGLFGANGNVLRDAQHAIVLVSTCKEMLQEVQLLLQTLGISSAVRQHNKAQEIEWDNGTYTSRESYHLEITHSQDIRQFAELVNFPQESQREKLKSITESGLAHPNASGASYRSKASVVRVEHLGVTDDVYDFTCSTTSMGLANGVLLHNCSEFIFLDDTSCNLASLNLMKYVDIGGFFRVDAFRHSIDILILAMEILVGRSSYPTKIIEENSHNFRPLGLGYANLGALLMSSGMAYDSDEGRDYAACITALMHNHAYVVSSSIARDHGGPFAEFPANKSEMLKVLIKHKNASFDLRSGPNTSFKHVHETAHIEALEMVRIASEHGVRNAQVTVLAPTGTIGFMMDCDTTGIEPDIALVKHKKLVGGGSLKYVNQSIRNSLVRLGYTADDIGVIIRGIESRGTAEGIGLLRSEHLSIFDCAMVPQNGTRSISWQGHIKMMGAVQPFLSGAISKTVNMPTEATREDIANAYFLAWTQGVKAIAIYRDGCKQSQPLEAKKAEKTAAAPLNTSCKFCDEPLFSDQSIVSTLDEQKAHGRCLLVAQKTTANILKTAEGDVQALRHQLADAELRAARNDAKPTRRKLPDTRRAITHKFRVGDHKGYLTIGEYDDGSFGEIFIDMSKEGTAVSGFLGALGAAVSIGVQYGVPIDTFIEKFRYMNFEPLGYTGNPDIPIAKSIVDYVFRFIEMRYRAKAIEVPVIVARSVDTAPQPQQVLPQPKSKETRTDAPPCYLCGELMVRNGSCHKCLNCGSTSGCS